MRRRFEFWATAVAALAMLACASKDPGENAGLGSTGAPTEQTAAPATGAGNGGTDPAMAATGTNAGTQGTTGMASGMAGPAQGTAAPTPGMAAPGTPGMSGPTPGMAAPGTPGMADPPMSGTADEPAQAGMDEPSMGDDPGAMSADPAPGMLNCGPEVMTSAADLGDTDTLGPWKPMHVERTGPNGSSWVYYPEGLGEDGLKHPVFQWGPGAGTGPSSYLDHLNLLASHGFVIISQASTQSGREALTWILEENEKEGSMWYQKLDPDRVGRGGHSMGALQSMREADDPRLKLYVLVCGGARGGGGAADIDDPTIFLGGQGLGDTRNFEPDYAEVTGPAVFIRYGDTDHIYCARDNLGPWVAFMRWQFCGEEKWKKEFEPGGAYCTGDWEACETKNL
ncbi:MAG: hypothetical protein OXU20_18765 [Myxococcales bacterium]|nr:hypothetical protein [Myxococcales bacterium]